MEFQSFVINSSGKIEARGADKGGQFNLKGQITLNQTEDGFRPFSGRKWYTSKPLKADKKKSSKIKEAVENMFLRLKPGTEESPQPYERSMFQTARWT